ncbi:hypothetical protein HAX54_031503 [Datura stramonium]|uniref:Uncharacterized protein n=1 Tax=Datura stramonium TaxID=4076 RepID=A0ABS8RGN6_DATST|nr:hypothetical protein [Datura stramonium]
MSCWLRKSLAFQYQRDLMKPTKSYKLSCACSFECFEPPEFKGIKGLKKSATDGLEVDWCQDGDFREHASAEQ